MTRSSAALLAALMAVATGAYAQGQLPHAIPPKNPYDGKPEAIQAGLGVFRSRCADCHGIDARGVRGPDLTQIWASGRTDQGLFQTVRNGVSGTEMPAIGYRATDDEVWKVLAYLRTLAAPAGPDIIAGDVTKGERVFRAQCAGCHRVNGRGGRLGPDLSRIGAARTRAAIVRRIRGGVETFQEGFAPVTVTAKNGQAIQGVKKNEDLFSVQIMDSRERIQGYLKSDVREVTSGTRSAMPAFGPDSLSENDLNDVAAFLATRRGFDPIVQ